MTKQIFSTFALALAVVLMSSNFSSAAVHQTTAFTSHSSANPNGGDPVPTGGSGGNS